MSRSEAELAASLVAHLHEAETWEIYEEVRSYPGIADVVAREIDGPRVMIVETKTSLGLSVLAQARRWIRAGAAHYVAVAVPWSRRAIHVRAFAEEVAREFGIGVFTVERGGSVRRRVAPRLHRHLVEHNDIRKRLRGEHKTHARAGSARGGYWTEFKGTCRSAARYVAANPGCTLKQLVDGIDHHYASDKSAKAALVSRIRSGVVKKILAEEGRPVRLWPDTAANRKRLNGQQE